MEKLTISVEGCTQIFFHCNDGANFLSLQVWSIFGEDLFGETIVALWKDKA